MSLKRVPILSLNVNRMPNPVLLLIPVAPGSPDLTPISQCLCSLVFRALISPGSCSPLWPLGSSSIQPSWSVLPEGVHESVCLVPPSCTLGAPSPPVVLTIYHVLRALFPVYVLACFVQPPADVRCSTGTSLYI